jgi:hypothetical protein
MSSGYIEPGLSNAALDIHRALASLQEELEAIDYYHQRVDVSDDAALSAVLAHNRDDEMEHATMLLEWLRRTMPGFEVQMKKFLFTSGDITTLAAAAKAPAAEGSGLGLGNLK